MIVLQKAIKNRVSSSKYKQTVAVKDVSLLSFRFVWLPSRAPCLASPPAVLTLRLSLLSPPFVTMSSQFRDDVLTAPFARLLRSRMLALVLLPLLATRTLLFFLFTS